MVKEFKYRGKNLEDLQQMGISELAKYYPSRQRRSMLRGFNDIQKKLLEDVKKKKANIKTHVREMVILPQMVGLAIKVHSGKEWIIVNVTSEMLGHTLGEFVQTRKPVKHSGLGIGATKGSKHQSVK